MHLHPENKKKKFQIGVWLIILFFPAASSFVLSAQKHQAALEIGYGKTALEGYSRKWMTAINVTSPFDNYLDDKIRLGAGYYFTPPHAMFGIMTGINYDYASNLHFFRLPLGIEFSFGNKLQLIAGGGLYSSYLFAVRPNTMHQSFFDSLNRIQLGSHISLGLGYRFSSLIDLNLVYKSNTDLTTLYTNWRSSPGGARYSMHYKGYDGFLALTLKYTFSEYD